MQESYPKKEKNIVLEVGSRIRAIREELQMIPSEFARKAGLANSIIYEAESGTRNLGLSVLARLSKTYGISLNWLALGLGPRYLKDNQLPYRGDGIEILGNNFPITDAPDLAAIIQDKELREKLELSVDEIQYLGKLVKDYGRMARIQTREDWLKIISDMRQTKLNIIAEFRELMESSKNPEEES